jgi:hypothetical protein
MIHIHQGGTIHAYCGQPVRLGLHVSWEDATTATCPGCTEHFTPCCPGAPRGRCKIGCPGR